VLEAAGIAHAEAFVALTPNDSANIVSARVARDIYRVPHVLARLHDPAHAPVCTEFGIATVGSVQTTVNRVIQLLHHRTLEPHQTFGNGETLLVRSRVPAYLAGRRVAEFNVPRVIARVNDPANDELFNHSWGVDALVSPATALVSMIRQES
jgi:trk system potassium uptake protein